MPATPAPQTTTSGLLLCAELAVDSLLLLLFQEAEEKKEKKEQKVFLDFRDGV